MSFWQVVKVGAKGAAQAANLGYILLCQQMYQKKKREPVGGKTVDRWDAEWRSVGRLSRTNFSQYRNSVGVYRATLGNKIMYIGRAIEHKNGGLQKRLRDYTRRNDSGRKHKSGQLMNEHADDLHIDVIIVGSSEESRATASTLEQLLIGKHKPEWNVRLFEKISE